VRYRRAHENALKQFLARNVHVTAERTGVLIFVSLAEHYAEVVADSGINAKVQQKDWDDVIRDLTNAAARNALADGFVVAITAVGKHLAVHARRGRKIRTNWTTMWSKSEKARLQRRESF
jgi:putative membrane protein